MYKKKNLKLASILNELERLKWVEDFTPNGKPNTYKAEAIKSLKQTIAKFLADYDLFGTDIYNYLNYQISQL